MWVAVGGAGTSTIAYSYNGTDWTAATNFFSGGQGSAVAWNGSMWVAVGLNSSNNTIATSSDGMNWFPATTTNFFSSVIGGLGVAWNGLIWVAVGGAGTSTIAYSYNGTDWTAATNFFSGGTGHAVAWNGSIWVAVGSGTNTIATSIDGINWTAANTNFFSGGTGYGVVWNGSMWVAVGGSGTNTIAYSYNGKDWTAATNFFSGQYARGLAYNSARPNTITFTTSGTTPGITGGIVTTPISLNPGDVLDVVSDKYYNQGFSNFSLTVNYT
jgi:hypothetical protein